MKSFECPNLTSHILGEIRKRDGAHRPEGIHGGELVLCLNKAYYRRQQAKVEVEDNLLLRFTMGHTIQSWLTGSYEPEHPYTLDGIWLTPDFTESYWCPRCEIFSMDPEDQQLCYGCGDMMVFLPWEVKMTYLSSNKDLSDHWPFQCMAYCKVLEVNRYALPCCHIMGNWNKADPMGRPVLRSYILEFTQEEIDANWEQIKQRRDVLQEALDTGVAPNVLDGAFKGMAVDPGWQCWNEKTRQITCPEARYCAAAPIG